MNNNAFFMLLTDQCNMRCPHCYNELDPAKRHHSEGFFDTTRLPMLLDCLAEQGFSKVMFSGGEALLHPDIMEIIHEAKNRQMSTALFTNGKLLTPDRIRELEEAGLDELRVSFNELVWIKGRHQYEKIFHAQTRYLDELQDTHIRVGFIFIISRNNIGYVTETYQRLLRRGVSMKIQPLYLPKESPSYNEASAAAIASNQWTELSDQFRAMDACLEQDGAVYGNREEILRYLALLNKVFVHHETPDYCPTGPILVMDVAGNFHPCLFRHDLTCGCAHHLDDLDAVPEQLKEYQYFQHGGCYREECLSAYR